MNTHLKTCLAVLIVLFVSSVPSYAQKAGLKFSEPGWDFGKREQTDTVSKVIQVTNTGARTVHVKKIELTCGCIEAKLDKMTIGPGESVKLNLRLVATRGEGAIKRFVIIHSDDPFAREVKLPMTGFIRPIWTLDVKGRLLDFGEVKNGASTTKRVTLTVRPEYKIDIVDVIAQTSGGDVSVKRTPFKNERGYGWYLDITLSGQLPTGDFEGITRVETDFSAFRFRGFRLVARIITTTEVSPKVLRPGVLKPGTTWTGEILVTKKLGAGMRVASAFCKDPRVKLDVETIEEGKRYRIKVALTPGPKDTELRGTIAILVDEPGSQNFEVKFRARVQGE